MAKKSTKPAPRYNDPEEENQEAPEDEPAFAHDAGGPDHASSPAHAGTASKADACRAALAEGITTTEEAVAFARSRYGVEIKPTDFTLYKSKAKRGLGDAAARGKPGRKPKAAGAAGDGHPAPPRGGSRPAGGQSDLLAAMEAMKPLVDSLGADRVKRIVDLLR